MVWHQKQKKDKELFFYLYIFKKYLYLSPRRFLKEQPCTSLPRNVPYFPASRKMSLGLQMEVVRPDAFIANRKMQHQYSVKEGSVTSLQFSCLILDLPIILKNIGFLLGPTGILIGCFQTWLFGSQIEISDLYLV